MMKIKKKALMIVSCVFAIIFASVFIISKTLSHNQNQGDGSFIPNNILQLVNFKGKDIIWSEDSNEIIIKNSKVNKFNSTKK